MNQEEIRNLLFSDLLDELLKYLDAKGYNQQTLSSYRRTLRKIGSFFLDMYLFDLRKFTRNRILLTSI